jgi:ATP-dependent metalloprotease
LRSQSRSFGAAGQDLKDAVRRLESLSQAERKVLSCKTAELWSALVGQDAVTDADKTSWQDLYSTAITALQTGDVKISQNNSGLVFNKSFLRSQAPLLQTARGFKTRVGSQSKPFVKESKPDEDVTKDSAVDEAFKDVLKQLKISSAEKEKVNIALSAAMAGAKNTEYEGTNQEKTGAKKLYTWANIKFWEKLQKFGLVLIVLTCLLGLSQIFNFPIRISKGANEISPEDIEITFDDVKGCDEAKQELQEVVEFLMNPDKFSALGGKLPKGCLLVGPPGTGKTLLARAVAGQAGVPFFHASGSEFDEVLVGQGARRVRDLFKAAKERAPCVIFIDEIDSVGSKRTSSTLHPYANQTINQLLSEMDGFVSNEGVIVLGATNRSDDLDKALLRPGRFDTQVSVVNPDVRGRIEILELYVSKIKYDDSVNIESIAKRTMGFSGADLQNLVNTAAIRAAIEGKEWVGQAEFEVAYDKHTMGTEWKSRVRPQEDLKITAYHEAGHVLVAYFTQAASPLHKVTIVAKGQSGGHTAFIPKDEEWHRTKEQFKAQMDVAMGGRAAEELVFGKEKITGGASSDLESATSISEYMVKKLGMSEKFGLRVMETHRDAPPQSQGTKELVDSEIKLMMDDSYKRALTILTTHRRELNLLAEALLKYETLDAEDIKAIVEHKKPPVARLPTSTLLGFKPPGLPVGIAAMGTAPIEPPIPSRPDGSFSS